MTTPLGIRDASPAAIAAATAAATVPTPTLRPRRLRRTAALRALVRETRLDPSMFVAPIFVRPGVGIREPIGSMPGVARVSPDEAVR
ncbi:MAG TPA: hypothetical protein VNH13_03215, partial [Candidatus Acidoferrales bacterium]|nr:hypothetical protein [Candidatus Acidoferrales bacterium]